MVLVGVELSNPFMLYFRMSFSTHTHTHSHTHHPHSHTHPPQFVELQLDLVCDQLREHGGAGGGLRVALGILTFQTMYLIAWGQVLISFMASGEDGR